MPASFNFIILESVAIKLQSSYTESPIMLVNILLRIIITEGPIVTPRDLSRLKTVSRS